jgi:hypothetical protein
MNFNFNDFEDGDLSDQLNSMNISGEFVTVKGRKLRKSNKKEVQSSQPNLSTTSMPAKKDNNNRAPALAKTKQQSLNLELKSTSHTKQTINGADLTDASKPKATTTTTQNPKPTSTSSNPANKTREAQQLKPASTVTAQPFAAVASSSLNKTVTAAKSATTVSATNVVQQQPEPTGKPYLLEFKHSVQASNSGTVAMATSTNNSDLNDITEPSAFPPLISDIVNKSENSMFLSFMTKSELTNQPQV